MTEVQSQSLSNEAKLKINSEMDFLVRFLAVYDFSRGQVSHEGFLKPFLAAIMAYDDMIGAGSSPDRAKAILCENLKRTLVGHYVRESN